MFDATTVVAGRGPLALAIDGDDVAASATPPKSTASAVAPTGAGRRRPPSTLVATARPWRVFS
jgi:hypothetical protein